MNPQTSFSTSQRAKCLTNLHHSTLNISPSCPRNPSRSAATWIIPSLLGSSLLRSWQRKRLFFPAPRGLNGNAKVTENGRRHGRLRHLLFDHGTLRRIAPTRDHPDRTLFRGLASVLRLP